MQQLRPIIVVPDERLDRFLADLLAEYTAARAQHGPGYASHHEAYAVLLKEVQEYWQHVCQKPEARDVAAMYGELVQVAQVAMAAAVGLLPLAEGEREP